MRLTSRSLFPALTNGLFWALSITSNCQPLSAVHLCRSYLVLQQSSKVGTKNHPHPTSRIPLEHLVGISQPYRRFVLFHSHCQNCHTHWDWVMLLLVAPARSGKKRPCHQKSRGPI